MLEPMAEPILAARDVHVRFDTAAGQVHAVRGVDLDIHASETVALVGESGSGKSAFAKSFLRLHQPPFTTPRTHIEGKIVLSRPDGPIDLIALSDAEMRAARARDIGIIFQDALSALNPTRRAGEQIAEALGEASPDIRPTEAKAMAVDILDRVGIPDARTRSRAYPHQLSGGQRQRVMIAIAAVRSPQLLIADEPTTALDVTVQARLLRLLKDIQIESRMAMLFITHDLTIVAEIADRVAVMHQGQIVEIAPTREIFGAPQHDYTKHLLASLPGRRSRPAHGPKAARLSDNPLIRARGISVTFGGTMFRKAPPVYALRSVDLSVYPGERLGIVGESGSGKTTLGRVILGLQSPTEGMLRVGGRNPFRLNRDEAIRFRRKVQVVFQDTAASLDPRMAVGQSVWEGLDIHRIGKPGDRGARVRAALEQVGLNPEFASRFPHTLSGGERQRVNIARSLVIEPEILIADEPVSALDVSIQAQILDLLNALHDDLGLTMVFISHDLWVVRELCERIAVMKDGEIVETGQTEQLFEAPSHPYTRDLLGCVSSLPEIGAKVDRL